MRLNLKAALVAVCIMAAPLQAVAQQIVDPPPPAGDTDAAVQAWIDEYLRIDGWVVVGADNVAVSLLKDEAIDRTANGLPIGEIRHEYFRPVDFGGQPIRSVTQLVVVECEHSSQYLAAMTIYEHNNLQQNHGLRRFQEVSWTAAAPGSLKARTIQAICSAAQSSSDQD